MNRWTSRFDELFEEPENEIFRIVFFPDRIYHARYLIGDAHLALPLRRPRGALGRDTDRAEGPGLLRRRAAVQHAAPRVLRAAPDRAGARARSQPRADAARLVQAVGPRRRQPGRVEHRPALRRARRRLLRRALADARAARRRDRTTTASSRSWAATRRSRGVPALVSQLEDVKALRGIEFAVRENDTHTPRGARPTTRSGTTTSRARSRCRTRQEPSSDAEHRRRQELPAGLPARASSSPTRTRSHPVRYRNAMIDDGNPDRRDDNVIEMRWVVQREFGSDNVFFHEVTIPPGTIEGTHRHIGTEELYYIVEGEGIAYMADGDDPANERYPLVERPLYGLDPRRAASCRSAAGQRHLHQERRRARHPQSQRTSRCGSSPSSTRGADARATIVHGDAVFRVEPGTRPTTTRPTDWIALLIAGRTDAACRRPRVLLARPHCRQPVSIHI